MLDRQAIRDDVVARLRAGDAIVPAGRVFPTRNPPLTLAKLPALCVYTLGETGESIAEGTHPTFRNTLPIVIEAVEKAENDEELDDAIDALCEKVANKLLRDPRFVDQFEGIKSFNTEIALGEEGEKQFIAARLTIEVVYVSEYPPDLGEGADLEGVDIRVDATDPADANVAAPGPDGRVEAGANVDLPTGVVRVTEAGERRLTEDGAVRVIE